MDDVARTVEPLPTRPLGELFPDALTIGGDPALPVIAPDGVHPLLSAVGRAFAEHRPLVLSPDVVWLTISQGVAQHVRLHAEELRSRLMAEPGRRLEVVHDGPMPTDPNSWYELVGSFGRQLAAEVTDAELFACDFSTSTDIERVVGQIVLLDVFSPYFSLWLTCVCGIPSVTLTGTVEDWRKIRKRVDGLAGFGLESWCRSLVTIADQFVRAAAGDPDTEFWQRIYNPADAYGGDVITGWVARLYPYLRRDGGVDRPNPLLDLPIGEPRELTSSGRMGYDGPGVRSDVVPATLSRVIVNINDMVDRDNYTVVLHAGLVAVAQDSDGALRPVAGWHLSPAVPQIDDVIDRIIRDHHATPPGDEHLFFASADLAALYRAIGAASLFDGVWRLRPIAEHGLLFRGPDRWSIITVIDLADGRSIGAAVDHTTQTMHWLTCRVEEISNPGPSGPRLVLRDQPADVPVYGTSFSMLLAAALDTGGDISHLEVDRLDRLDSRNETSLRAARTPPQPIHRPAPARRLDRQPHQPPSPDLDIHERIAQIRGAKEAAIDGQDFEHAAYLRALEKELLADLGRSEPSAS
ncbi:DUF4419 domain-containing protein [Micromonospora sp. NBC_01796]|uniref:DUF4419 domain-containing protein n=1 Tax=Micromonospora sp. NBC_01796 TaxID=2975987 RepID=UPI002DD90559|nr:DUF4419 domain-containing protein [Micromonospora sp. NBC_01796]WSA86682.1 DUF4419 domain-containing protein [Micromonospora sp. NBC_01796]